MSLPSYYFIGYGTWNSGTNRGKYYFHDTFLSWIWTGCGCVFQPLPIPARVEEEGNVFWAGWGSYCPGGQLLPHRALFHKVVRVPSFSVTGNPFCLCPFPAPTVCLLSFVAGYENYGYGYGYGQENTTNYGYGMATSNTWDMPGSDTNVNPSAGGSASADSVLSRMNPRLDTAPRMEADMLQGGVHGSGGER